MKIGIYTRIFSKDETGELERQEEKCKDFVIYNEEELCDGTDIEFFVYEDIAEKSVTDRALLISGIRKLRDNLKKLDMVVVTDTHIITSDIGVFTEFQSELNKANTQLIIAREDFLKKVIGIKKFN